MNVLKKPDPSYNPNMPRMNNPVIKGKYKVNEDTRFILIVEHKEDEIYWAYSPSIYKDTGEPNSLNEAMTIPNGNLLKMSAISEVNNFLEKKACIPMNRSVIKSKGIKPGSVEWIFRNTEEPDGLINQKSRNLVRGYAKVLGVDCTESFSPFTLYTSTSILIRLNLYHK